MAPSFLRRLNMLCFKLKIRTQRTFSYGHCVVCSSVFFLWPLCCLFFCLFLMAIVLSVLLSFSYGHCVVCSSVFFLWPLCCLFFCGFWLLLWYLQALLTLCIWWLLFHSNVENTRRTASFHSKGDDGRKIRQLEHPPASRGWNRMLPIGYIHEQVLFWRM